MRPVVIPDKLYFRIGEVARLLKIEPYVLRFWETEFPALKPGKGQTGHRMYRRREVELAVQIKSLLYEQGFTIAGARQKMKDEGGKRAQGTLGLADRKQAELLQRAKTELEAIAALLDRKRPG